LLAKKPDQRFADGGQLLQALRRETAALTTDDAAPRRGFSLRFKLPLALVSITLIALLLSISTILKRQQHALEHMAITSGETIATFVTKNAAVSLADNAGLPAEQQDWTPLQAFVAAASQDGGVRGIVVVDAGGTIRAASDGRRVGRRYAAPAGEQRLNDGGLAVTNAADGKGGALRFVRPIRYAGADFGSVDILLPRTSLDAAMANARTLMIALASIIMLVVLAIGYMSGAMVVRPLRRLQQSFDAAREQGFALRISHRRRDEIGALFDGFNRLAAEIEPRLHDKAAEEPALDATCIQIASKKRAA
jgi:serine/threonine-protein kinase